MDRSRQILSAIDELRQIRADVSLTGSLDVIRGSFERLQEIRRQHLDDFDLQIIIADAQQELIERARELRNRPEHSDFPSASDSFVNFETDEVAIRLPKSKPVQSTKQQWPEQAEIPPDVPKLDQKSWKLAIGLAVLFTVGICASFFYLIQTARRMNLATDHPVISTQPQLPAGHEKVPAKVIPEAVVNTTSASITPTLRLYTDLAGGTVSVDDQPPRDLGDGELHIDSIAVGTHSVKVESHSGSAAFNFVLDRENDVPRVTEILKSNNAVVVLLSVKDGKGRLTTDAPGAFVSLDGKPADSIPADGLLLSDLGTQNHELNLRESHDSQKFVLTYTPAPTLTVFVKSDASTGFLTVATGQDDVSVIINDLVYKRRTERGNLRIPLKMGGYRIRVHKDGFQETAVTTVQVKKSEEASVQFHMQPVAPEFSTLQIKNAQPATSVYVDHQEAATVGADGTAKVINIKPGDHLIELHHDQAITKQISRTFEAAHTVTLSGADVALDHLAADNKTVIPANPGTAVVPPPEVPQLQSSSADSTAVEQVHKGGRFVAYHTPKTAGKYYFQAHAKLGGMLKRSKLQWYAGYRDEANYILFSVDGKHADVREVRNGKAVELGRVPFTVASDEWVQVEVTVKAEMLRARAKTVATGWTELSPVTRNGRDFTQDSVGLYIPSNEEVAVANFRFSER